MVGGQSWLAHASVLSGLAISDQGRYRALLASPRRTLLHLAHDAGWQTAAVMPAITLAWPEAGYFGYDRILAAADLGYRGQALQLGHHARPVHPRAPSSASSSTPPRARRSSPSSPSSPRTRPGRRSRRILPWDALGDGRVFDPYATAGDPPEVVWRDDDRVRAQYRLSLDYVLRTVASSPPAAPPARPLLVVLGDHQPAPFVSGDATGRDAPVHVIGPPGLLARLDAWGWTPGMLPAPDAPVWPMAAFRDRFLAAFAAGAARRRPPPSAEREPLRTRPER